jgi:predicted phage terminase large subunit-like protein
LAEGFGRRVRNILSDRAFRELFPACQLAPDSQAAYRFETVAGGEFSAVGRGGPVTGRGASLLILDDLIKDSQEANSEAVCHGIIEWLESVVFTRMTPTGRILCVATRWSERDPVGWLMSQPGWTTLHLPAFAEASDPLGRKPGQALWPDRYPVEALAQIRKDVGPRVFACLYQGNVAAAAGTIFKRDWFRHYQHPPEKFTKIIQSWDTSFKTGRTNDYSVCATLGQTQNGIYLLALYRAKVEFPELKRKVGELADLWQPEEILVEDRASGQSLVQELKLSTSHPVIAVQVDRDKETRAAACTGYFESGRVLFPEGAAWLADLEDELASFPGSLHDDCVDAITQALNRLRSASGGVLGLVDYLKGLFDGKHTLPQELLQSKPQPVIASSRPAVEKNFTCPVCRSTATVRLGGPNTIHCNMCATDFDPQGNIPTVRNTIIVGVNCCSNPLPQRVSGFTRCGSCSAQSNERQAVGVSRAWYQSHRGSTRLPN